MIFSSCKNEIEFSIVNLKNNNLKVCCINRPYINSNSSVNDLLNQFSKYLYYILNHDYKNIMFNSTLGLFNHHMLNKINKDMATRKKHRRKGE